MVEESVLNVLPNNALMRACVVGGLVCVRTHAVPEPTALAVTPWYNAPTPSLRMTVRKASMSPVYLFLCRGCVHVGISRHCNAMAEQHEAKSAILCRERICVPTCCALVAGVPIASRARLCHA